MENQENIYFAAKPSPKKTGPLGPVNDPRESNVLKEIESRRLSMGKWRGKTPTGKPLPGGRKRRHTRRRGGASGWIGIAYDGAQVSVDDDRAKKWMNTRTYDSTTCKPPAKYIENSSLRIPKGENVCTIGGRKKKSRRTRRR
jgi:hypothetical protein